MPVFLTVVLTKANSAVVKLVTMLGSAVNPYVIKKRSSCAKTEKKITISGPTKAASSTFQKITKKGFS